MRYRHLGKLSMFTIGDDSTVRVKLDDRTMLWADDDAMAFKYVDPAMQVSEVYPNRWKAKYTVGSINPAVWSSGDTGKYIARIKLRSSPYKSEIFVGDAAELNAYLDSLGSDVIDYWHTAIRDNSVMTEREFEKWARLEDAIAGLRQALTVEV